MFLSFIFYNVYISWFALITYVVWSSYWALIYFILGKSRKTIPFPRFGIYRKMSTRFSKLIGKSGEVFKVQGSLENCSFLSIFTLPPFLHTIFLLSLSLSLLMLIYLGFSRTYAYIITFFMAILPKPHRFKP